MNLVVTRDHKYDQKLSTGAETAINKKNWSALYSIFLQRINMEAGGVFDTTLNEELVSITAQMRKMFPGVPITRRLVIQYCVMLGSWR